MSDNTPNRNSFKISAAPIATNNLTQGSAHAAIHHTVGSTVLTSAVPRTINRIFQAWRHKHIYQEANLWIIENFTEDQAHWDWDAGFSHINGIKYPTAVYFKNPEDYLAFKIRFSELCV